MIPYISVHFLIQGIRVPRHKFLDITSNFIQVIITSKQWPLREKFLERIRSVLSSCYRQSAWYPGSKEKFQAFRNRFTNHTIEEYGQQPESGSLPPWLFVSGLSPDEAEISTENWCGVLQVKAQLKHSSTCIIEIFARMLMLLLVKLWLWCPVFFSSAHITILYISGCV